MERDFFLVSGFPLTRHQIGLGKIIWYLSCTCCLPRTRLKKQVFFLFRKKKLVFFVVTSNNKSQKCITYKYGSSNK